MFERISSFFVLDAAGHDSTFYLIIQNGLSLIALFAAFMLILGFVRLLVFFDEDDNNGKCLRSIFFFFILAFVSIGSKTLVYYFL